MINGIGSQGMHVNRMLDALGLPDSIGDAVGAQIDIQGGDMAGFMANLVDLNSGLSSSQMDQLFGSGLCEAHHIPRPGAEFRRGRKQWGQTFGQNTGVTGLQRQKAGDRLGRRVGQRLERAILRDPQFKAQLEGMVGGMVLADGRTDLKVTVQRYDLQYSNITLDQKSQSNTQLTGIYASLAKMENNITKVASSLTDGSGGISDAASQKLAKDMGMKQPLAFEDMLFLMMMKYAKKKEGEITGKMNELSTKTNLAATDTDTPATEAAALFGGNVGGPSLTAYQQKAMQIAGDPSISNEQKTSLLNDLGQNYMLAQQQAAAKGATNGTAATGAAGTDKAETSDTLKQMQLQKLTEDLKKMYDMLSNIMKSMHEMQMTAIRNLK